MRKEKKVEVKLEPINKKQVTIDIKGVTDLVMDKFTDETQKQILAKQSGLSKSNKKKVRDTKQETRDAIHLTNSGKIGFPANGFKKGMMECTSFVGDKFFSKKLVSGAVKIVNTEDGLIPIEFKKQDVWQHNINGNIKFNPIFRDWKCKLVIQYDANNITPTDIATLLNYAGFYQGIGMDRPKGAKGGTGEHGMYEVKNG